MTSPPARPDAIVVGAGIVGAACAYELARDGLRVLVLDSACAGGGTTAAGMGHLVVMDDSEPQFALAAYSLELWHALAERLPADCEYDPCGTLWLAADDAQLEAVEGKRAAYEAHGVAAEPVDAAGLRGLEPRLRPDVAGALLVPGDCVVYPPNVARFLIAEACAAGAEFRPGCTVEEIRAGAVVVDGRAIGADVVVNAAGATAPALTPGLPIVPRKGHLVITDRYPDFCHHQLVELGYLTSAHEMSGSESVAFNVQPRRTGQVLIGSSRELVGWDGTMNPAIVARMLERAVAFMPAVEELRAIRSWTGFRPATPDALPLIGSWDGDGVWIAAGHEGLGITTSLGTARVLADLIAGRTPEIDAAPFAPARAMAAA